MPLIYSVGLFLLLIIVLAVLRQKLIYELSGTSLLLFGSTKPGIRAYSIIFLPGTIIHELSHWIVAEILQVRTGQITILPDWDDGDGSSRRLGSVATERSDPFRGFLIGVAPFISGMLILLMLGQLLQSGWETFGWGYLALIIYGIVVIGNSMMISKEDRRTWPIILILLALILILIYQYYPTAFFIQGTVYNDGVLLLNQILGVTVGLNLVMIGGSYFVRRLVEKLTNKRILHK